MTLTTHLAILQQSEYDWPRFVHWCQTHPEQKTEIQPEQWTLKLKLLRFFATLFVFLPIFTRLRLALLLTEPAELLTRKLQYYRATSKLRQLRKNGLQVVAIAGSYAKTSTKHIMSHSLGGELAVYATPRSINTMLGISQVILSDLTDKHQVFLAELGEYKPGQIVELLNFLRPDWGIVTPIGHQHLELLGSFNQVIAEFAAVKAYFEQEKKSEALLVSERNHSYLQPQFTYGEEASSSYQVLKPKVTQAGTEFQVKLPKTQEVLSVFMPLFGVHQAVNTLPSFWLAEKLKLSSQTVAQRLSTIPFLSRRHEPLFAQNQVLILDNSYNTNPDSVQDSLKLLNQVATGNRILITTGFVEQGTDGVQVHLDFGRSLATQVDFLGLFSAKYEAEIIQGFLEAGGATNQVMTGENQADVVQKLQAAMTPGSVLVFEGGYQEIHG